MTLFAPTTELIETFLSALKDRRVDVRHVSGLGFAAVIVPEPTKHRALADEILASVEPFLALAYDGAKQRWVTDDDGKAKMAPAHWPHVCDECGAWQVQTDQRANSACNICSHKPKGKRRRLEIPWADASRGRPRTTKPRKS